MILLLSCLFPLLFSGADEIKDLIESDANDQLMATFELKGKDADGNRYELGSACYRFLRADGTINTDIDPADPNSEKNGFGGAMIRAFERVGTDCFYNQADYSKICPNFKNWTNVEKKKQFLIYVFAVMAHYEATCRQKVAVWCENDYGVGPFQLEESQEARHAAGRDPYFCMAADPEKKPLKSYCFGIDHRPAPSSAVFDSCSIKFQAECAASTFKDIYCGPNKKAIGEQVRYWEKLREGRKIFEVATTFPGCH